MRQRIQELHTTITEKLGSESLARVFYILFLLKSMLFVGIVYYYFRKREQDRTKKLNDKRMREIRENQMKVWEKERSEYVSSSKDNSSFEEERENVDKQKKKTNKLSWMSANTNTHLNPHFSYLSTYKPSVSKRYPCKKCCGQ
ncbi:uncharacterized protein cubi_01560 [Cryptosporidium ubiquitum]|uniref:Uncharacterized protein n=1 Tax=Cryptosporidium ubiquitum TaxID=857276 RepID=A0A1J4MFI9_9CRYT|nr:uncharacterized protein cubi_01560 [Cryptosporidium ubiquitum]OII72227.1 hypothetical protein cubi_01560 [Cryptosporidium ubiquitum]